MVPAGYTGTVEAPLLFTFHGGAETAEQFGMQHPGLFAKCNSEGVILVLPDATVHPQSRSPLWGNRPFDIVVDDRAFVAHLLEHLATTLNVDRKRVYAAGFSNGGSLAHYLGASTTNLLAAIAAVCTQTGWNDPVTGAIPAPPAPLEPMPVLMVRGTLDAQRPYNGGPNADGILTRSAADDVAYWTSGNSCGPITSTNAIGNVTRFAFEACAGATEVILIRVGGMPHIWPDAADGFNYNANVAVIDFLLTHSRP
jgi:polyhydroxybutyrate depolymerase